MLLEVVLLLLLAVEALINACRHSNGIRLNLRWWQNQHSTWSLSVFPCGLLNRIGRTEGFKNRINALVVNLDREPLMNEKQTRIAAHNCSKHCVIARSYTARKPAHPSRGCPCPDYYFIFINPVQFYKARLRIDMRQFLNWDKKYPKIRADFYWLFEPSQEGTIRTIDMVGMQVWWCWLLISFAAFFLLFFYQFFVVVRNFILFIFIIFCGQVGWLKISFHRT